MAALVFDSGGLIALERRDRFAGGMVEAARQDGLDLVTSALCIAQVWRDPARQAVLTRSLAGFREHPLDPVQARATGRLLAQAGADDIVDAAIVMLARDGDVLITSDATDLRHLVEAIGVDVRVVSV